MALKICSSNKTAVSFRCKTYFWPVLSLESTDLNVGVMSESNRRELKLGEEFLQQYQDAARNGYESLKLTKSEKSALSKTNSLVELFAHQIS